MQHGPYLEVTNDTDTLTYVATDWNGRKTSVDILGSTGFGDFTGVVVEYDGAYWHRDRADKDLEKTKLLLDDGYLVVRVRETGLEPLDYWHPNLLQVESNYKSGIDALIDDVVAIESYLSMHRALAAA